MGAEMEIGRRRVQFCLSRNRKRRRKNCNAQPLHKISKDYKDWFLILFSADTVCWRKRETLLLSHWIAELPNMCVALSLCFLDVCKKGHSGLDLKAAQPIIVRKTKKNKQTKAVILGLCGLGVLIRTAMPNPQFKKSPCPRLEGHLAKLRRRVWLFRLARPVTFLSLVNLGESKMAF